MSSSRLFSCLWWLMQIISSSPLYHLLELVFPWCFLMPEHASTTYPDLVNKLQKLAGPQKSHKISSILAKFLQAIALLSIWFHFFFLNLNYLFYFTTLYWFCHTLTWIHHGCTCAPHPEPPLPPPSPSYPSGSSQCISPGHPVSCIEPGLAIRFTYDNIHVSMPFSHIIPPSPSPTESRRLFYTSVSLLLSHITGLSLPAF